MIDRFLEILGDIFFWIMTIFWILAVIKNSFEGNIDEWLWG